MQKRPDPLQSYEGKDYFLTPAQMWNQVHNYALMYDGSYSGWLTREGRILGANYAAHEKLLYWLGVDTKDAEQAGWVRYSRMQGYQCLYRMTAKQRRVLEGLGHNVDMSVERTKPSWNGTPIQLGE